MHDLDASLSNLISDELVTNGYAVVPDFFSLQQVKMMADEVHALRAAGAMQPAGVGQGAERVLNTAIRRDLVYWLDADNPDLAVALGYLGALESLRLELNRSLSLGLFEFEGHYAVYPAGTYYRRHLDRFHNDSARTLTCILYLNQDWVHDDGGQLRLYLDDGDYNYLDIEPAGGTLVTFLSARFWHEVLPARRERMSVTGWYKTRGDLPLG